MSLKTIGPPLTWDEIADAYDAEVSGSPARTLPTQQVMMWARRNTEKFATTFFAGVFRLHRKHATKGDE